MTAVAAFQALVTDGARLAKAGDPRRAAAAFEQASRLAPQSADVWRALGDMRHRLGEHGGANAAHLRAVTLARLEPEVAALIRLADEGRYPDLVEPLGARLRRKPTDVAALVLAARLNLWLGRTGDAAAAIVQALTLAPELEDAWPIMRDVLQAMPPADALRLVSERVAQRPDAIGWRGLEPAVHERAGDYEGARRLLEGLVRERPEAAGSWVALGHIRMTLGDAAGAAQAYRHALTLAPGLGDAWWGLADLKTLRFDDRDLAALCAALQAPSTDEGDRITIGFALARGLEQAGDSDAAFDSYAEANRRRRATIDHDRGALGRELAAARAAFTPEVIAGAAAEEASTDTPIFIVGMPRSGSTLVEQILASHPDVEATRELDEMPLLARELMLAKRASSAPAAAAALGEDERRAWGERYIARTRCQRRAARPFFIDKLPANFRHVGLIRLLLPQARVVDVRRDAIACGFSIFKQWFAGGYTFAYDLDDIAAWRRDYLAFMRLWNERLPGYVTLVDYDALVADPEPAIRALLDAVGLPFDPACLTPHTTERPIRTPSGNQVREPIGLQWQGAWRPYAARLSALADDA